MPDTTDRPAYLHTEGERYSSIIVPVTQLDSVTSLLDENNVPYSLDDEYLQVEDRPEVAFIDLDDRSDPAMIRRLLDSIPQRSET